MNHVYTTKQLAERWNCCSNTVRTEIVEGRLPAFRVGRLLRVPAEAVAKYESGSLDHRSPDVEI